MNPVVHFELPYKEPNRIAKFYESAFGWKVQFLGEEMDNYILVTTAEKDVSPGAPAGAINGGLYPIKPDYPAQYPAIVIGVEDIRAAMKRVVKAGGKVLGEPIGIPGYGEYVAFMDTENNRNSMLQPPPGI